MNTADRSIALIDTALRRRFEFVEMMPNTELLKDMEVTKNNITINIGELLKSINDRIEVLYDREHTIGHSYFLELEKEQTKEKLGYIFEKRIIPLLSEYFYSDWSKIKLVLNDKPIDDCNFEIIKEKYIPKSLENSNIKKAYEVNNEALEKLCVYQRMIEKDEE